MRMSDFQLGLFAVLAERVLVEQFVITLDRHWKGTGAKILVRIFEVLLCGARFFGCTAGYRGDRDPQQYVPDQTALHGRGLWRRLPALTKGRGHFTARSPRRARRPRCAHVPRPTSPTAIPPTPQRRAAHCRK